MKEEVVVIVGAGLTITILHFTLSSYIYLLFFNAFYSRLGIPSLILESADTLRTQGYALALWTNAWNALDALAIGNILRHKHTKINRIVSTSVASGLPTAELTVEGDCEVRRINRRVLVETLKNELPEGTIRYSSKLVQMLDSGPFKLIHLADGTVLKTKLLIGCDGVNSVVAKFLGFNKPSLAGRGSVRGYVEFKDGHGFEPDFLQWFGNGVRYGVTPCDDHGVYWFFTYVPSPQDEGIMEDRAKMKQFVVSKLGNVSDKVRDVFVKTELSNMTWSELKYRGPWELYWGNIGKDNVCIAGDALHPMTPDIGQGGCSALEDGVVLARVIAKALTSTTGYHDSNISSDEATLLEEHQRIKAGLETFAKERRWRSIKLVTASYLVGYIQQSNRTILSFLREKVLPRQLASMLLWMSDFDCGKLTRS